MLSVKKLPKDPKDALKAVLVHLLSRLPSSNTKFSDLRTSNHSLFQDFTLGAVIAKRVCTRIEDQELVPIISRNFSVSDSDTLTNVRHKIEASYNALLASEISDHFLDTVDVKEFDEATIPANDRDEIRALLTKATDLAAKATFLSDPVRRSFLHKIRVAENELFKEHVGIQAFFAVAYEGSRLLRRYGEDAKPMAEAIETARTKTERHVEGYKKIEASAKPKQLPKPEKSEE